MRIFDPERSWALLIGTATYRHLPGIPEAHANLAALADVLTSRKLCGFKQEHIRVIADPADTARIGAALHELGTRAEDLLLIYYVGHGLLDRRGRLHLGLTGTHDDPALLSFSALPYELVRDSVAAGDARCRMVILDCCFSGRAIDASAAPSSVVAGQLEIQGAATLTSSSRVSVSLARAGGAHTAFTSELLTAMRRGDPSGPPILGVTHLFDAVRGRLGSRGLPEPQLAVHQNITHLGLVRNSASGAAPAPDEPVMAPPRHRRRPGFPPLPLMVGAGVLALGLLSFVSVAAFTGGGGGRPAPGTTNPKALTAPPSGATPPGEAIPAGPVVSDRATTPSAPVAPKATPSGGPTPRQVRPAPTSAAPCTIPANLVGRDVGEVEALLKARGVTSQIIWSDSLADGTETDSPRKVYAIDPVEGRECPENRIAKLRVYHRYMFVRDLVNWSRAAVEQWAKEWHVRLDPVDSCGSGRCHATATSPGACGRLYLADSLTVTFATEPVGGHEPVSCPADVNAGF
ncbi:caspase family protein [Actinocorallia longicatena]|uniref:Peptidase C14 caspase domain-containing protein n=1 Tax=Actinocorallia longicatena TaxID=111803 RepID=A0ABP6QKC9_9ACTN